MRGHPSLSLLRAGVAHGFTMLALDRPGYRSSAPYPEAMARPEHRVQLAYAAVDRILGERQRGAGFFVMAHSGGCELGFGWPRRAGGQSARHRIGGYGPALSPRGPRDPEDGNSGPPPSRPARAVMIPDDAAGTAENSFALNAIRGSGGLERLAGLAGALLQKDARLAVDVAQAAGARAGVVLDAADAALRLMEHPR